MMKDNSEYTGYEIAVVGMSGKFPGAKTIDEFWTNLVDGKESIRFFTDEELLEEGVDASLIKNQRFVKAGGYLENKANFDASFFNYSSSEADIMDPQIRVFHEVAYAALEDAGYIPDTYEGSIGLFAGASQNSEWIANTMFSGEENTVDDFTKSKYNNKDFMTTMVAYKLNLKGPVVSVQTACSTSLVAIHMACRSLLLGECKMALAGGVSISVKRKAGYLYRENMILSPDGHCRAFDAQSGGTVIGEGAGVVALKKLKDAIKDGDHIYAVVKGSAINNDGVRKVGYTAPSVEGQVECMKMTYKMAKVNPDNIGFIEAHGTGTSLGDPIEIDALNLAFGNKKEKHCVVGSVKTNIGHLDVAAGVAGFIKAVLSIYNKQIPPTLHFQQPNQNIDFENGPFYVSNHLSEWKNTDGPLQAGVSSLGIGGTNAHIVLEEAPSIAIKESQERSQLLVFSAKTQDALNRQIEQIEEFISTHPKVDLEDVAWTLQIGRKEFPYRAFINPVTSDEIQQRIKMGDTLVANGTMVRQGQKKIVFMFSGQGAQYVNMGKELYDTEPFFRESLDTCFKIAREIAGIDYKSILYPKNDADNETINETINAQPLLFMFEYALAKLLEHHGVVPNQMIGHSIGEYAAACIGGALDLKDALNLVITRGKLMQALPSGSMLSVSGTKEKIEQLLPNELSIAAVNSPGHLVISGRTDAINDFGKVLKDQQIPSQVLHTSHAFHSDMMTPMLEEFRNVAANVEIKEIKIPFVSNISGRIISNEELKGGHYWCDHIRNTVRFSEGIRTILQEDTVLVEIGPGTSLKNFAAYHLDKENHSLAINTVRHPKEQSGDYAYFLSCLGKLWQFGVKVNWKALHPHEVNKVHLPTYPFQEVPYSLGQNLEKLLSGNLLLGSKEVRPASKEWYYQPLWRRTNSRRIQKMTHKDTLLIFASDEVIQAFLTQLDSDETRVITVSKASTYRQISEDKYEINPLVVEDYIQLFDLFESNGIIPTKVVNLLHLGTNEEEQKKSRVDFYSLLYLIKGLNRLVLQDAVNVTTVLDGVYSVIGNETLKPMNALALGLNIVASQENPTIVCKCVDICPEDGMNAILKGVAKEILMNDGEKNVAIRNGHRWTRIFEKVVFSEVDNVDDTKLQQDRCYLITGGLGDLGFTYAKYLMQKYRASLILTGREDVLTLESDHPKRIRLKVLQDLGEVRYFKASVADHERMSEILSSSEIELGPLQGIIHAAGVTNGKSFRAVGLLADEEIEKQFESKVEGALVLEQLFKGKELDFCLLVSSISTVLGGKEYAAYASANVFLDTLSHTGTIANCVSINYDALDMKSNREDMHILNADDTVDVLKTVLGRMDGPNYILSVGDLQQRIKRWVDISSDSASERKDTVKTTKITLDRSGFTSNYVEPQTETEIQLCQLIEQFFGMTDLGIQDDFFELGVDSLKAMTLINQLHKTFDLEVSLDDFFQNNTVQKLSTVLDNRRWLDNVEETDNSIII